jgi:DNA-binding MarR family transcriptional regulator
VTGTREPGDELEQIGARLSAVLGQLIRALRRNAPADVGPGSLAALATLTRSGPVRLGELAGLEGVSPPTLTRIVAALESSGYVVRESDPTDRRAARVTATAAGARLVRQVLAARAATLTGRLGELPVDQVEALAAALPALEALAADRG